MIEHINLFTGEILRKILEKQLLLNFFVDFIIFIIKLIACILVYYRL